MAWRQRTSNLWLIPSLYMLTILMLNACSTVKIDPLIKQSTPSVPDPQRTVGERSNIMCGDTISAEELAKLAETLADVVQGTKSLEELERWFRSQPCIESFRTENYLIETEPPQKELLVTFKMDDGSTATRVIDIILYPDQTFGLAGVYEP